MICSGITYNENTTWRTERTYIYVDLRMSFVMCAQTTACFLKTTQLQIRQPTKRLVCYHGDIQEYSITMIGTTGR